MVLPGPVSLGGRRRAGRAVGRALDARPGPDPRLYRGTGRRLDAAMIDTARIRLLDVTDAAAFERMPPCADPGFDHRSCDYWEDAERGSKAIRLDWLTAGGGPPAAPPSTAPAATDVPANPFLADLAATRGQSLNPFLDDDDDGGGLDDNPFAPRREPRPTVPDGSPRKLRLLGRGLGVVGSYAKILLLDDTPAGYCQFGPLTAYPRAQRTRDLYPALPDAPLPAVITCIATTAEARGWGLARTLVDRVCEDLAERGFAAVETYPEIGARPDATSAATPGFWQSVGFVVAAADERFPVMRRELG
jgi:ribosomal protein S18 acetylase RimI-like enzyme